MLTADLLGVDLEHRDILGHRRGEWMVARIPAVLLLIEAQQREINDPEKIEPVCRDDQLPLPFQYVRAIESDLAQDFACREPLVSGEQDEVVPADRFDF